MQTADLRPMNFTPAMLLQMAIEAMEARETVSDNSEKYDLYRRHEQALQCAEWMENNGVTERKTVGPFGEISIAQGQRVRIKAGAVIHGFGSAIPAGGKVNKRAYRVTVVSVDNGWVGHEYKSRGISVRNQQVHWAGESGYWRWTDIENVEIV